MKKELNDNSFMWPWRRLIITGKKKKKVLKEDYTYTKKVVFIVLFLAEVQICMTYILAFMDKNQVVEQLSMQTTITIVGVVVGYFAKSLAENLSKHGVFTQKIDGLHASLNKLKDSESVQKCSADFVQDSSFESLGNSDSISQDNEENIAG